MAFVKTPALVLKTSKYSETSLIVLFYTLEKGKVRCIAKGARRGKGPFTGKLEPLNQLEIVYIAGRSELRTLKECSIFRGNLALRDELSRMNSALRVLALIDDTQTNEDPHPDIYLLAAECLQAIETSKNLSAVLLFFKTRLLAASGYSPDYSACCLCGRGLRKRAIYSPVGNGFLCNSCGEEAKAGRKPSQLITVPAGTMEILRRLQKVDLKAAERTRLSPDQQKNAERLFKTMFRAILEKKSRSGEIIDSIERT